MQGATQYEWTRNYVVRKQASYRIAMSPNIYAFILIHIWIYVCMYIHKYVYMPVRTYNFVINNYKIFCEWLFSFSCEYPSPLFTQYLLLFCPSSTQLCRKRFSSGTCIDRFKWTSPQFIINHDVCFSYTFSCHTYCVSHFYKIVSTKYDKQ